MHGSWAAGVLLEDLSQAIGREVEKVDRRRLARAVAQFIAQHQSADFSAPALVSEALRAAYLAIGLPTTYAALPRAPGEVRRLAPKIAISSLLDLGAGPGTALCAAAKVFPSLTQAAAVEFDMALANRGRRLMQGEPS